MKVLIAINKKNLINKYIKKRNEGLIIKTIQYREAILEFLDINKNIDVILLYEKLPGNINIEELIIKINQLNKKIKIIFFLEKENIDKKNKLNKLGIKNIFLIKEIKNKNIINIINNNYKKKKINNKINNRINNKKNKTNNKNLKKACIIGVTGNKNNGKETIINLIIKILLSKNKKILFINNNIKNKIKINNNNLKTINFLQKNIENKKIIKIINNIIKFNNKKYDYIFFNVDFITDQKIKIELIKIGYKIIYITNTNKSQIQKDFEFINNNKKIINKDNYLLIYNKYIYNSISYLIIKNIFNNFCSVYKINNNKNIKKNIFIIKKMINKKLINNK